VLRYNEGSVIVEPSNLLKGEEADIGEMKSSFCKHHVCFCKQIIYVTLLREMKSSFCPNCFNA
jgi:hypothetical protein